MFIVFLVFLTGLQVLCYFDGEQRDETPYMQIKFNAVGFFSSSDNFLFFVVDCGKKDKNSSLVKKRRKSGSARELPTN